MADIKRRSPRQACVDLFRWARARWWPREAGSCYCPELADLIAQAQRERRGMLIRIDRGGYAYEVPPHGARLPFDGVQIDDQSEIYGPVKTDTDADAVGVRLGGGTMYLVPGDAARAQELKELMDEALDDETP